jgi:hypothetical protein
LHLFWSFPMSDVNRFAEVADLMPAGTGSFTISET